MDFDKSLAAAAQTNNLWRKQEILSRGCSVDGDDASVYSPLHYASRNGHLDACLFILQNGAKVDKCTRAGKATSLHRAAYAGHVEVVKALLRVGANPLRKDVDGLTPLQKAEAQGHTEIVNHDRICQVLGRRFKHTAEDTVLSFLSLYLVLAVCTRAMTLLSRSISGPLKNHLMNFKIKGMFEDHLAALEAAILEKLFKWEDNNTSAGLESGVGSKKVDINSLQSLSPWEGLEGKSDNESFPEKKMALIEKQGGFAAVGFSRVPTPPPFGPVLALSLAYVMEKSQKDSDQK